MLKNRYNVKIRPLKKSDAQTSWLWRNNPEIWKYTGKRPNRDITLADELEWITKVSKDTTSLRFAIIVDEDRYVGNVQLTDIFKKSAQFHMFIGDQSYWGKGIGQMSVRQLIRWVCENTEINYIWLTVHSHNKRAIKLYLSTGFELVKEKRHDDFLYMGLEL